MDLRSSVKLVDFADDDERALATELCFNVVLITMIPGFDKIKPASVGEGQDAWISLEKQGTPRVQVRERWVGVHRTTEAYSCGTSRHSQQWYVRASVETPPQPCQPLIMLPRSSYCGS